MRKYFCDRCKKDLSGKRIHTVDINFKPDGKYICEKELCMECASVVEKTYISLFKEEKKQQQN